MTYRNINLSEYQRRNIDLPEYRPVGLTTFRNSDLNLILEKRGKRKKGLLAGKNELKGNLSGYRFLFNHSLQNSFSRLCFKRTNFLMFLKIHGKLRRVNFCIVFYVLVGQKQFLYYFVLRNLLPCTTEKKKIDIYSKNYLFQVTFQLFFVQQFNCDLIANQLHMIGLMLMFICSLLIAKFISVLLLIVKAGTDNWIKLISITVFFIFFSHIQQHFCLSHDGSRPLL